MDSEVLDTNAAVDTPSSRRSIAGLRIPFKAVPILGLMLALIAFPMLHIAVGGTLNFYLHLLLLMFMHTTFASSWNIMGGYTGYISLGHNVFFTIGAYLAGLLLVYSDIPIFLSAPLAGIAALIAGVIIGLITLRVRGPSFIIATVAMVLVLRIVLDNWDYAGGANGMNLPLLDVPVEWSKIPFYYFLLLTAALAVLLSHRIRHSKLGLGLRAISQDEIKAESAGIPTNVYKITAFALSGVFIGVAGAFYSQYVHHLRPSIFLLILIGAQMVLMCILGGKGTVAGPVVGAVFIISINELVLNNLGGTELNIFVTGLLMLLVLVFFPDGIVGSLRKMGRLPGFLDWD